MTTKPNKGHCNAFRIGQAILTHELSSSLTLWNTFLVSFTFLSSLHKQSQWVNTTKRLIKEKGKWENQIRSQFSRSVYNRKPSIVSCGELCWGSQLALIPDSCMFIALYDNRYIQTTGRVTSCMVYAQHMLDNKATLLKFLPREESSERGLHTSLSLIEQDLCRGARWISTQ